MTEEEETTHTTPCPSTDKMDDTDVILDDTTVEVIETPVYTFQITHRLTGNYGVTRSILQWLTGNMSGLVDDYNKPIFGKVNIGFNESILKTFGKKPVCDVYIKVRIMRLISMLIHQ